MIYETSLKHLKAKRATKKDGSKDVTALEVQNFGKLYSVQGNFWIIFALASCYLSIDVVLFFLERNSKLFQCFFLIVHFQAGVSIRSLGKIGSNSCNIPSSSCEGNSSIDASRIFLLHYN